MCKMWAKGEGLWSGIGWEKDPEVTRVFRRQQQAAAWARESKQAEIAVSKFICWLG